MTDTIAHDVRQTLDGRLPELYSARAANEQAKGALVLVYDQPSLPTRHPATLPSTDRHRFVVVGTSPVATGMPGMGRPIGAADEESFITEGFE